MVGRCVYEHILFSQQQPIHTTKSACTSCPITPAHNPFPTETTQQMCIILMNNLRIKPSDDDVTRMEPLRKLCKQLWPYNGKNGITTCLNDAIVRLETFGVDEEARADVEYLMKAVIDGIAYDTWHEHLKNTAPPVF